MGDLCGSVHPAIAPDARWRGAQPARAPIPDPDKSRETATCSMMLQGCMHADARDRTDLRRLVVGGTVSETLEQGAHGSPECERMAASEPMESSGSGGQAHKPHGRAFGESGREFLTPLIGVAGSPAEHHILLAGRSASTCSRVDADCLPYLRNCLGRISSLFSSDGRGIEGHGA